MDAYRWKIFAKDSWIFQLFGSNGSVIGRIIREITYSPTLFIFYLFFILHSFCAKEKLHVYIISVKFIFFSIFRKEKFILCPHTFLFGDSSSFDDCFRPMSIF